MIVLIIGCLGYEYLSEPDRKTKLYDTQTSVYKIERQWRMGPSYLMALVACFVSILAAIAAFYSTLEVSLPARPVTGQPSIRTDIDATFSTAGHSLCRRSIYGVQALFDVHAEAPRHQNSSFCHANAAFPGARCSSSKWAKACHP